MKKLTTLLVAMLFTAGMAFAQTNTADTNQSGNNNEADVEQTGMSNTAEATQIGNQNDAFIQQGNFGGGAVQSNYAEADIEQVGNQNGATINQRQGFAGGTAVSVHSIYQDGLRNEASLTTYNGGNFGDISQMGNDNWARGRQSSGPDNDVQVYQDGNSNWADVNQLGSEGALSDISQVGIGNETTVDQSATSGNAQFLENTTGNNNTVTGVQYSTWAKVDLLINGNQNTVDTEQDRTGKASMNIYGSSNTMTVFQGFDRNTLGSTVDGNGNTITVNQAGMDNDIVLDGSGHWDRDGVDILGNSNTVTIDQLSDMNRASSVIDGSGNTATILQN